MEYTDVKKIPGILLFVDFEKAFDTIEWEFIQNVKLFNFEKKKLFKTKTI